jgi:hypothetical protein
VQTGKSRINNLMVLKTNKKPWCMIYNEKPKYESPLLYVEETEFEQGFYMSTEIIGPGDAWDDEEEDEWEWV